MSYILEALKKSEAERNRHNAAMRLVNEPMPLRPQSLWPKALAAALVLNAAAFASWWYWQDVRPRDDVALSQPVPAATAPLQQPAEAAEPAPWQQQPTAPQTAAVAEPAPAMSAAPPAPAAADAEVLRFQSLPMSERASFPQMEFSTHLYASDPDMRRVVINGQRAQEGDTVAGGVYIERITETGVIVLFRGRRIALDVIRDWRL
jgi:general secretion pathway protein B